MHTLNVALGDRSYPIHIGSGLFSQTELLTPHIPGTQVLIVSNETVAPLYLEKIQSALGNLFVDSLVLPDGEAFKNLDTLSLIYDKLIASRFDRSATVLALGGGVVGDMAGYAAASYQRGVHFVQVPTTLLAQVDSSVGGKTGINHPQGKNMIGAFYQPRCVIADIDTLSTLPERELSAGLAEVIKYGLVYDETFLCWLEEKMPALLRREPDVLAYAVKRSCEIKADVVAQDERESGIRALLNLGHTFGHAIEAGMGYGLWLHGEAVAAGTVMAADLSARLGWLKSHDVERITALMHAANLPSAAPSSGVIDNDRFLRLMSIDKKVQAGKLRFILLRTLGNGVLTDDVDHNLLLETLTACREAEARIS